MMLFEGSLLEKFIYSALFSFTLFDSKCQAIDFSSDTWNKNFNHDLENDDFFKRAERASGFPAWAPVVIVASVGLLMMIIALVAGCFCMKCWVKPTLSRGFPNVVVFPSAETNASSFSNPGILFSYPTSTADNNHSSFGFMTDLHETCVSSGGGDEPPAYSSCTSETSTSQTTCSAEF